MLPHMARRSASRLVSSSCRRRLLGTSPAARSDYDAIIIGAGVIGCSLGMQLARAGWRTLNIDKGPGAGSGSTGYSSGALRSYYSAMTSTKLANEGFMFWEDWAGQVGLPDDEVASFRQVRGVILVSDSSRRFVEAVLPHHEALGIPFVRWDREEVERQLPFFDLTCYYPPRRIDDPAFGTPNTGDRIEGAVFFPNTGYVSDPMRATQNLQTAAINAGGSFQFNAEVVSIDKRPCGKHVAGVTLSTGERITAGAVVNVGGPHSAQINRLAFDTEATVKNDQVVQTRAMRQEVAHVDAPAGVDYEGEGVMVGDFDVGCYWRPEVGNRVLIGGMEPDCDTPFHQFPSDADKCSEAFTDQMTNIVYRAALRMPGLPLGGSSSTAGIVAMYDVADDWVPIYDKTSLGGYYLAIGTSGNQFKCAGPAGQLMAAVIQANESGADTDEEPVQFKLPLSGFTIDTGFYSRKRKLEAGSGTVLG